jgi:hypothetical protein
MGMRLVSRRTSVLAYLALAALAHGAFDALLSTDGTQLFATMLVLVLAGVFFALLRRTLRHGAVPPRATDSQGESAGVLPARRPTDSQGESAGVLPARRPTDSQGESAALPRTYLRVGSRGAFYACAAAMILSALSLTVLGSAYELLHHRAGVVFVTLATAMLAWFGLAAYGASATIPLDVAIDADGITFAGGCTPWSAILGVTIDDSGRRPFVRVQTRTATLRLGPASPVVAQAIVQACMRRA